MGLLRTALSLVLGLLVSTAAANALTKEERELIVRSVRPSQLPAMEAAVGRLESLPFLVMDLELDVDRRRIEGQARLDWLNTTGQAQTKIPIRFTANGGGKSAPKAGWKNVKVTMPEGIPVAATVKKFSKTVSFVTLPKPLAPGERIIIEGNLEGVMFKLADGATDPLTGGLASLMGGGSKQPPAASGAQYGTFACGEGICTLEGFAPEVPAFIDGRFDTLEGTGIGDPTYSEVSNLLLSIRAPKGVVLAATGLKVGEVSEGSVVRTTFAMAATREVGLVASKNFISGELDVGGVTVRSFALEADDAGGVRALESAASALQILDEDLGAYPWSFLNIAESALTGGAGGVEMPGLALSGSAFYRQDSGLMAMLGGTGMTADMLDFITRHEVAHQWWHAQVGSHAQIHPYVDEPLAQWSALHTVRKAKGDEAAKKIRDMQIALNFQGLEMMSIPDGVVARPASRFSSMTEYAGLVYGKAPLFYEAMRDQVGEEHVLAGLQKIVAKRRFRRATPDELRDALCESAGPQASTVRGLWQRWFHEKHGREDVGSFDLAGIAKSMGVDIPQDAADAAANPYQILQELFGDE